MRLLLILALVLAAALADSPDGHHHHHHHDHHHEEHVEEDADLEHGEQSKRDTEHEHLHEEDADQADNENAKRDTLDGHDHDHDHDHDHEEEEEEEEQEQEEREEEETEEEEEGTEEDDDDTFTKELPVRIGPDGRPLLFGPKIEKCKTRISHGKLGKHHYFLSWREPWHKFEDWDWFNARNFCRERCMDLISIESRTEMRMFTEVMKQDNVTSIWTSGRKCNFKGKGCEQRQFQPINVNGWFWAGADNKRIPPTNRPSRNTFWSHTGQDGKKQPDNHDGLLAGKLAQVSDPVGLTVEGLQEWHDEACLAVLNNAYDDGIKWHDMPCHYRSVIVCEDSDTLLERALKENPGETIPEPETKTE